MKRTDSLRELSSRCSVAPCDLCLRPFLDLGLYPTRDLRLGYDPRGYFRSIDPPTVSLTIHDRFVPRDPTGSTDLNASIHKDEMVACGNRSAVK